MVDLPWRRAGLDHSAEARANVELLQTDVMRFMAILGFCLMAIFALVHSIPPAALTSEPETTTPAMLQRASIDQAYAELEALNQELDEVGAQVAQALAERDSTMAALGSLKQTEQTLSERYSRAERVYQQQLASIAEVGQKLRTQRDALTTLQQRRKVTHAALEGLENAKVTQGAMPQQSEPQRKQPTPPAVRTATAAPVPKPVAVAKPVAVPKPAPVAAKEPKQPEQKGYALRFSSDLSLRALIAQHRVGFFGFVGEDAWQLRIDGGVLKYRRAPLPKRFHEMTPETVPDAFVKALRDTAAPQSTGWGVTLPRAIQDQIQRHMDGDTGGILVIHPDGRVRLRADTAGG